MTAILSPRFAAICLALGSLAALPVLAQEPVQALWKPRDVSFLYRSSNSIYACSALRDRVASILRAVGARDDLQVRVDNCEEFAATYDASFEVFGGRTNPADRYRTLRPTREQTAHVRVRVTIPTEATPELMAQLEKEKSRRDLISRVTGNPGAFADVGVFPAQRQMVTLSHKTVGLEPEECELLEQLSNGIFRQLDVRVVRRNFICNPRQSSRLPPEMTVEALYSGTIGTTALPQIPPPSEEPATVEATTEETATVEEPGTPATETPEPKDESAPK